MMVIEKSETNNCTTPAAAATTISSRPLTTDCACVGLKLSSIVRTSSRRDPTQEAPYCLTLQWDFGVFFFPQTVSTKAGFLKANTPLLSRGRRMISLAKERAISISSSYAHSASLVRTPTNAHQQKETTGIPALRYCYIGVNGLMLPCH